MLSVIGFVLMAVLMVVLIKSWVSPPVAFIGLPLIAAVIAGFSAEEIGGFIGTGMKSMLSTAILFVFSISYFTLMDEIGLFDPIIKFLTTRGQQALDDCGRHQSHHLCGPSGRLRRHHLSPAFLPIIKRMGFRKEALLAIIIGVVAPFGVSAQAVAATFLLTATYGTPVSPSVAAVYVGLGLADVSIGDHIKFSLKFVWPLSILVLIASTLLGVIPF